MKIFIYKIYNNEMAYIGSTVNFKKRMERHKSDCNNEKSKAYNLFIYQYIRTHNGWENFKKEIIYECEVKDKTEQRMVEQKFIKNNECKLNMCNSYTTDEERKEKVKEWYEQNKDKKKEQSKQYKEQNKDKIKEQNKQYYEQNKEKIREKNKKYAEQKINCPHCNLEMRKDSLTRHIKRKH